jgi:hypothetical protein
MNGATSRICRSWSTTFARSVTGGRSTHVTAICASLLLA